MKQVMEWVIDPAADDVWESVAIIITDKGENQKAPKTDAEWDKVRNGAATLVEAGNLLMTQPRARDDKKWFASAKRMSEAGLVALRAAEKKDVAALFDSGALIYNACSACHFDFRVGEVAPDAKPAATVTPAPAPAK
jgi:mono/diheme cytochrome c family protein